MEKQPGRTDWKTMFICFILLTCFFILNMFKYLLHKLELQDFNILNTYKVFLMDCDGVIWKGSESIPKVADSINFMKEKGKKFYFVVFHTGSLRTYF